MKRNRSLATFTTTLLLAGVLAAAGAPRWAVVTLGVLALPSAVNTIWAWRHGS